MPLDTTTGIVYLKGGGSVSFTNVTATGQFKAADGSESVPSYSFTNDLNTGMFSGGADSIKFAMGGTTRLTIASGGQITATSNIVGPNSDSFGLDQWGYLALTNGGFVRIGDVNLHRDAANTLALRNGTNAQAVLLYKTFTDSSNYERVALQSDSNTFYVIVENAGTGGAKNLMMSVPTTKQLTLRSGGTSVTLDDSAAVPLSIGASFTSTAFFQRSVTASITASTTQTQGQGALTTEVNNVATCANANDTVTLPAAVAGRNCVIFNNGAQTLQIFPASGDDLGAGVNTATTLAAGSNRRYVAYDATNWEIV